MLKVFNGEFVISVRCFDRAKVYELVDNFILNLLECIMRKGKVGLCRDDRLGKDLKLNGKENYENLNLRIL